MSGPSKTPTWTLKLHGSRRAEGRKNEPASTICCKLPKMPSYLDGEGAEFYKRAGDRLVRMKLLTEAEKAELQRLAELRTAELSQAGPKMVKLPSA